jgi:formylglycine-generating enzyme required for sulfatase activity
MVMPTEAQWEYGCRAGTATPWSCAAGELRHHANLADATAKKFTAWPCADWEDGHVVHAPVSFFRANAFGLHDMHGNVSEWVLDMYGVYGKERPGDGRADRTGGGGDRLTRGGSFGSVEVGARSSERGTAAEGVRDGSIGVRPARTVRK